MRKTIHNFTTMGVIGDDSLIIKSRGEYERLLLQKMRDSGYVPILDMSPQFNINYIANKNQYSFVLTMFGVFVGKKKAHNIVGFSGEKFISR